MSVSHKHVIHIQLFGHIQFESYNKFHPSNYVSFTIDWLKPSFTFPKPTNPASFESLKSGVKGHGCSLHFPIKIESQNLEQGWITCKWPYPNQDQDAKLPARNGEPPGSSWDPNQGLKVMMFFAPSKSRDRSSWKKYDGFSTCKQILFSDSVWLRTTLEISGSCKQLC